MSTVHALQDWQTWVTGALGLCALGYLLRRWWPRKAGAQGAACGAGQDAHVASEGCGTCGGGSPCGRTAPASVVQWHPPHRAKH